MGSPVLEPAVSVEEWLAADAGLLERVEVSGGRFVIRRVGGNPPRPGGAEAGERLRGAVGRLRGSGTARWVLERTPEGRLLTAREPDVLVDGDALDAETVFEGVPVLAVEVWSPTNTLAEMNAKRRDYHAAGLPTFVEAYVTDVGDVHLDWYARDPSRAARWVGVTGAAGDTPLVVQAPRPFRIVPNSLLRPGRGA